MVIDIHSHLSPPEWNKYGHWPLSYFDVNKLLVAQEEAGVDLSVISNPVIRWPAENLMPTLEAIKRYHDFVADVVARNPDHFCAMALAIPYKGDGFLYETERALKEYGFRAVLVNSSVAGECLDSPKVVPLFELACRMDVPVFVHPPDVTVGAERMDRYRLIEMVGRPWDTTLSAARLILTGIFEQLPHLKLVLAHVGGAITTLPGRLDFGYELRHDLSFGPWEPDLLKNPPSYYIKKLYVDTMGFHSPAVMCAIATLGADHVLMGSDLPPVHVPLSRTVELVKNLPISEQDKELVLGGNAARLLKLN